MQDRIDQELILLRQRYPGLEYRQDGHWIRIPGYPLPEGWNRSATDVAFQIPIGYPGTPPYGICATEGLLFSGHLPDNCTPADPVPPFDSRRISDGVGALLMAADRRLAAGCRCHCRFEPAQLGSELCGTVPPGQMTAMAVVRVPERIYRKVRRHLLPSARVASGACSRTDLQEGAAAPSAVVASGRRGCLPIRDAH